MLDVKTYKAMQDQYGLLGSWAIWAEETNSPTSNIGDLSIFNQPNIWQILKPDIVFVGLNISRNAIKLPWGNFHDSSPYGKDFKLRRALLDTKWWGGYMTDIIKNYDEVDGTKVYKHIRQNPDFVQDNVKCFLKEIDTLNVKNPEIIAIGSSAHTVLTQNLANKFKIKKIPHYSQWISPEKYKIAVTEALSL
jgi:hypothetical protein